MAKRILLFLSFSFSARVLQPSVYYQYKIQPQKRKILLKDFKNRTLSCNAHLGEKIEVYKSIYCLKKRATKTQFILIFTVSNKKRQPKRVGAQVFIYISVSSWGNFTFY